MNVGGQEAQPIFLIIFTVYQTMNLLFTFAIIFCFFIYFFNYTTQLTHLKSSLVLLIFSFQYVIQTEVLKLKVYDIDALRQYTIQDQIKPLSHALLNYFKKCKVITFKFFKRQLRKP